MTLLTLISHEGDVEVELGTMVLDEAAEKERDVDVTVKLRKEDGSISGVVEGGLGGFDSVVINGDTYGSVEFVALGPDSGWLKMILT